MNVLGIGYTKISKNRLYFLMELIVHIVHILYVHINMHTHLFFLKILFIYS